MIGVNTLTYDQLLSSELEFLEKRGIIKGSLVRLRGEVWKVRSVAPLVLEDT